MKNTIRFFGAILCTLLLVSCVSTQKRLAEQRDKLDIEQPWRYNLPIEEKAPAQPQFPVVKQSRLDNGLNILVVEDHRLPIAQVSLVLKVGAAADFAHQGGLAYLSAQMLKEGSGNLSSLEFAESLANMGSDLSIVVNKDGSSFQTEVLAHKVEDTFLLLAQMVKAPRLSQEDFMRIKKQHQNLLASQQANPGYVAQVSFLAAAYGNHPYGHPNAGTINTVEKITLADVKKFIQDYLGPNNAALVAVGDVNLLQMEKLASEHLMSWPKAKKSAVAIKDVAAPKEMQTRLIDRANSPQTFLLVGQPSISRTDPMLASFEVFQNIIAGLPTSRLGANLREAKGWTYGVASQLNPLHKKGPLLITTSVQALNGADALGEIFKELETLTTQKVSDEELNRAKNGLLHSFSGRFNTLSQIASSMADQFIYNLPNNYEETYFDKIKQVTRDDILAVAKRLSHRNNIVAVAVGELESLQKPLSTMNMGKIIVESDAPKALLP